MEGFYFVWSTYSKIRVGLRIN